MTLPGNTDLPKKLQCLQTKLWDFSPNIYLPTLKQLNSGIGVSCKFWEILKNVYFVKHLRTTAYPYCQAGVYLETSFLVRSLLGFCLVQKALQ